MTNRKLNLLLVLTLFLGGSIYGQGRSELAGGQTLTQNQYLESPNKEFKALMQSDGNFCVYQIINNQNYFVWGSAQAGNYRAGPGLYFATIQNDGNFCIYRGTPTNNMGYVWGSQSTAPGGQFRMMLQNDGNFVVYKGATGAGGFLWNTGIEGVWVRVRGFRVHNVGAFVFGYVITNGTTESRPCGRSNKSGKGQMENTSLSVGQSVTCEIESPFTAQAELWPRVQVETGLLNLDGSKKIGYYNGKHCIYDPSSTMYAVYNVSGTSLNAKITYQGTGN